MSDCLNEIEKQIKNARRRLGSISYADFIIDDDRIDPVRVSLENAAESVRHISQHWQKTMRRLKRDYPDVGWQPIIQFRSDASHNYRTLDPIDIWNMLQPSGHFTLLERAVREEIERLQISQIGQELDRDNISKNQKNQQNPDLLAISEIGAQCFDDILTNIEAAKRYLHSLPEKEFCKSEEEEIELRREAVRARLYDASEAARRLNRLEPRAMKTVEHQYKGINWKELLNFIDDARPHDDPVYVHDLWVALQPHGYTTFIENALAVELGHQPKEVKQEIENSSIKAEKQGGVSRQPNSGSGLKR
ncbi:MAG TPA: HepT-like ribonuclease domain-containing protein [Candidatus Baltobacteraceae bacterium]|nr:HepT-like ribonuclease domain-containing protein [Candidatus Baltobacteraceae bacterium]